VNPPRGAAARGVHWLKPELVAQVKFAEWTGDGNVRQGAFQGLREDKPAADVVHEHEAHLSSGKEAPPNRRASARKSESSGDEVAGVKLSNPDKVLYPEQGVTKRELARYYEAVAEWLLPQLEDRPVMIVRCPAGHHRTCFYQKHLKEEPPSGIEQVKIRESRTVGLYPIIHDIGGVIALVQKGALEFHTWGSRVDELEKPDRMIFDLDPAPDVPWSKVVEAAELVHGLLEELRLRAFLKTTGGKGLHVVVPLARRHDWEEVKSFSEAVAVQLASALPERFTANLMKKERTGRIFIDYLRNGRGATAVAAFSTRSRPGASVSAPIAWEELSDKLDPAGFNVRTMPDRLAGSKVDPWKGYAQASRQCITAAMRKRLSKKQ
jgi:bifunctional non-homologous end joining protein LigD